jgi:hypothetical protein
VTPTSVPADSIPAPFNAETASLAALTVQDADGKTLRQATGVFVRPDEVATSLAAIEGGARGRVSLVGQSGSFEIGGVTGFDPTHRLVTLKVNGAKSTPLATPADGRTTIGDKVASLGTATRYREASFYEPSFTQGAITGYRDDDQMDVRMNGGVNLGAPLLNERGELIGIIGSVSGGNSNQATVVPVVYLAELAGRKQPAMSLAVAGAKDAFFDFRKPINTNGKPPAKDLEAKIISVVRDAHRKARQPAPPKVTNTAAIPDQQPSPEPTAQVENDDMANAVITDSTDGAFTAPGAKQTAYLIDTKSGGPVNNFGPKYLAIFSGENYVTDLPLKDHTLILQTFDLNRDGINELLLGHYDRQVGVSKQWAELVDINKSKLRILRDFGLVYQEKCDEASGANGGISASVMIAGPAAAGQFPDFRIDNLDGPCSAAGGDSPEWKYSASGKMPQKY